MASKNPDAVADATTEDAVDKAPKRRATKTAKSAKPATKAAAKAPKKAATPELTPGEEAAPAPKRTRKAAATKKTTAARAASAPEPEVALADVEDVDATAPAAPTAFGLLFQAPEPAAAPTRRRASAPVSAPAPTAHVTVAADQEADAPVVESTDAGDEDAAGRRRRRGTRGRRGRGNADIEPAVESAEGADAAPLDKADEAAAEDSESASARRRRRRRRGSSAAEGEDPPGTVTKVREPRATRDEPTAVRGSTRLEAKKQRRREGREAGRRRTIITEAEFLARRESVERVMVVRGRGDKTQIGVLEDGVLVEHYVSRESATTMAGNVYLGRVQNVLPSMEAAFVDIGKGRNAVLYAGEVNWDAAGLEINQAKRIENALSSGDTVMVQVTKDPIGHKGARLTSQISLPGRYLVYVPEGSMTGISRKLPDTERARLKAILKEVVPDSAGVIVRTAAEGASEEELRADVERLTKAWETISAKAEAATKRKSGGGGAPTLLYGEPDLTVRVIRDVFTEDYNSLIVAGDKAWSEVSDYVEGVAPDLAARVTKWTSEQDVFAAHRIDEQLSKAMDRKVWLPSGGSLVIDRTEAMTVVDVNTGRFVGAGGNLEETVTKNNIEAAEEIVRQLRLRDIGGIIVIDFIDMVLEANRDLVVRRLLECLGRDRTKHQVAEVTSLGLVQMTRKRVGSGLIEVFSEQCDHCNGRGILVHTEPVEKSSTSESSGNTGRARSRRGNSGSASAPTAGNTAGPTVAEKPSSSGPTAAQIAAAAHAAAVRKVEETVRPEGGAIDAGTPADSEGPQAEQAQEVESAPAEVAVVEVLPAEVVEAPQPAPRGRRRRGRVVAPAGPPKASETD